MASIHNVFKMHIRNVFLWFVLPWLILGASFLINLLISLLLGGSVSIYSGGVSSIYIWMLIIGIISLSDTFPFALGFSVRRTDYFLGTLSTAFVVCVGGALILQFLSVMEQDVISGWGLGLHFFSLPYLSDGTLPEQYLLTLVLLIHSYLLGFTISSIYRRFGKTGMWTFCILLTAALTALLFLFTYLLGWNTFALFFQHYTAFEVGVWMIPMLFCYVLFSYLLLRKATV